ncbi:MAG: YihY/virulence factor BrkB family protein [Gammaproteobacteria bacterium]|nr:YihY/virulence factor BrkB family protein [Gammaproteobacteria bacterium]
MMSISRARFVLDNPWQFLKRVIVGFSANQGFLLSGAVAYYTLLTIVPMFALILAGLSQIQETQPLLDTLREYLVLIAPSQADALIDQISAFQQNWKVVGVTGIIILLFFSSFAFTSLENAMSVIFFHRVAIKRRHFLISAIIPYCYILLLAAGMLLVSIVSGSLHSLDAKSLTMMGQHWSLSGVETVLVYLLGIVGEVLLLTSIYLVMPVGRLSLRHALIGGITAALLWELTRHVLVWYFSTLSLVNVVYGTFATVIIILLSLEAAAIILLLGAQVIAEYERIGNASTTSHGLQT